MTGVAIPRAPSRPGMPRVWRAALACSLLLALPACRLTVNLDVQETLAQVEQRRFAAMVAQDVAVLAPILADELSYTHSTGETETKAQFLETIRSGRLRYEAFDVREVDVRFYGDVALLRGRLALRARAGDRPVQLDLRYTDAYVYREGRWQMLAYHSTRIQ